ncbi:unnamed protein product [Hymenolepis diminuta]|uniref:Uncharacterized protein n=1 Tax=Hymenolepis diminuta TaxID=6216 RepID=A0A564YNS8_HYMDI|nr:unnamed protein product [Hymenolepis diminuta]
MRWCCPNLGAILRPYIPSRKRNQERSIGLNTTLPPSSRNSGTPETQHNRQPDRYSTHFRTPQKRFKVDPMLKRMYKQPLLGVVG